MIGRVSLLLRKDLLRKSRSPLAMVAVISFPLIFSLLIGIVFGSGPPRMPQAELLVEERDSGEFSRLLGLLADRGELGESIRLRSVGEEGRSIVEAGRADALLRIPPGFSSDIDGGRPALLELVRNPSKSLTPELIEQRLAHVTELLSAVDLRAGPPLSRWLDCLERPDCKRPFPSLTSRILVERQTVSADRSAKPGQSRNSLFLLVLPGVGVWALFMVGDHAMRDILVESATGTLRRQIAGSVSPLEIVLGKALLSAVLALVTLAILATIGWSVSPRPVDAAGFALLSGSLVLAVTGLAALIYGLARTERQGATLSSAIVLAFAFLGGSFIRLDSMSAGLRRFSPISPIYWGTSGYRELLENGATLSGVLRHSLVLSILGLVMLAVGSLLLQRSILSGKAA